MSTRQLSVLVRSCVVDVQCELLQPWPESQPEPSAGEPTGAWTLRCQVADHATLPLPGPSANDPLDLGIPQSLRDTLSVDERGVGPGTSTPTQLSIPSNRCAWLRRHEFRPIASLYGGRDCCAFIRSCVAAWYTMQRTILLERSRPLPTIEKPLPPPPR